MYIPQYRWYVRFEWDEIKNQINIRKHGIDLRDALDMFDHPVLTAIDEREDYVRNAGSRQAGRSPS